MGTQLRMISKKEAHKLISQATGNGILVLTYDSNVGMSDTGKYIKKKRGRRLVDKANVLVLAENNPIITLNLHSAKINNFSCYEKVKIDKSILFPKLE